ncbi:MAG TPA: hypothetical protein VIG51_12695 [Candidatus Baltobacteraceae bacterium]|jgi:cell division protein FtsL
MLATPHAYQPSPRIPNVRTAKNATQKRRVRAARARYAGISRFSAVLAIVLVTVIGYVMLMAHLTSMNYALSKAQHERTDLQGQTMRLDDQLSRLRSDERLAKIAARLNMHDPQQFAIVKLPPSVEPRVGSHLALLSTVAGWLGSR